jgi:hypothetical protein
MRQVLKPGGALLFVGLGYKFNERL